MKVNFEKRTLRTQLTTRGGGIEIRLDNLKNGKYNGQKMTAYQNYLGGGMLGGIGSDCTIIDFREDNYLLKLSIELKKYFCELMYTDFEDFENMPLQAY